MLDVARCAVIRARCCRDVAQCAKRCYLSVCLQGQAVSYACRQVSARRLLSVQNFSIAVRKTPIFTAKIAVSDNHPKEHSYNTAAGMLRSVLKGVI